MPSNEPDLNPNELFCSRCGMAREEWTGNKGRGVIESGEYYCCKGCAEDAGCTCDYDRLESDEESSTEKLTSRGPAGRKKKR
jgi:hypothetical protein